MKPRSFGLEIFAISLGAILLEVSYTRIFSFKVYYYFTYLIIGLAMLGLGGGGVWVAVSNRLRAQPLERLLPWAAQLAAGTVLLGYLVIAPAPLNVHEIGHSGAEVAKLAGVSLVLLLPFLAAGVAIATILGSRPERIGRLYAADLSGAGLACLAAIPLLKALTPPGCVWLAGLVFAAASLRLAAPRPVALAAGGLLCAALTAGVVFHSALPDPTGDELKHVERSREGGTLLYSAWNPVFRVDVSERPLAPDTAKVLSFDGWMGSAIHRFDGNWDSLEPMRRKPPSVPFSVTVEHPRVLVVGSAGGHEILASLYFGARAVTGVELNPVTVSLLTGRYADFAGRIHEDPRVRIVNDEARSFLQRDDGDYDLIWLVAPDSYAAMNAASSAAFVLTESYLYTVEMIRESLGHLAPGGVLAAQFGERDFLRKPNRTTRYLATAREALREEGIEPFGDHVLVLTSAGLPTLSNATILLSRTPFDAAQRERFVGTARRLEGGVVRWVPGETRAASPVTRVVSASDDDLAAWYDAYPYDVTPVTDDAPYFWLFTRIRDTLRSPLRPGAMGLDWEDTVGEQVMLVLLALVTVLAALLLGLPFVTTGEVWGTLPARLWALVGFAGLGLGFMFLEVSLLQRFTLFLGYPTHSLSVTLFSMLVFAGLGSLLSEGWTLRRGRALALLWVALAIWAALQWACLAWVFEHLAGAPLALRILTSVAWVAPLATCLGAFMPLGLSAVAGLSVHPREYVAWAWAVNGFASVISSILSTILAMTFGFQRLVLIALAVYALAALALARLSRASGAAGPAVGDPVRGGA